MSSTPYDLVRDDQDLRIPLHAEQAFFHGITFQAKLIGWQEVSRPNSRNEIVQAMRRIRYECKVQNMKKRKVILQISVDGVKVSLKKKKRKKKQWTDDIDDIELTNHPIYRIFYVSHDSSDLKIFSYIARDGSADTFKCSVFKSTKKSQAMRIVRTIGQAFEVCHKFSLQKSSMVNADDQSVESQCELSDRHSAEHNSDENEPKDLIQIPTDLSIKRPTHLDLTPVSHLIPDKSTANGDVDDKSNTTISAEMQLLHKQLEQQALQTRQALSQLMLVREQLITETNARIEAQARTLQLLQQNKELVQQLEHLATLGGYTYTENDRNGLTSANISLAPQSSVSLFGAEQQRECDLTVLKSPFTMIPNNHSIATINKQLNNLGTINQQLSTLTQQLNGLNQQSQNLQQIQNLENNLNVTPQLSVSTVPTNETKTTSTSTINTTTMLNNNNYNSKDFINSETAKQTHNDSNTNNNNNNNYFIQTDLFRSNQELLNRLQVLSLDFNNTNCSNIATKINNSITNRNFMSTSNMQPSFYSSNQMMNGTSLMNLNVNNNNNNNLKGCNNHNINFLGSNVGNLTPSPVLNRNFNSSSPILNSNTNNNNSPLNKVTELFISTGVSGNDVSQKLLRQSSVTALNDRISIISDGNTKIGSPTSITILAPSAKSSRSSTSPATTVGSGTIRKNDKRVKLPDFSLHITDENGKIMNSKRMSSAIPSTITRTTSEKVSNRSQLMSEVQRTAWARHTTK